MYGIFTYIYHKFEPNVGEYTSPMDPMGIGVAPDIYKLPGFLGHPNWAQKPVIKWSEEISPLLPIHFRS